MQTEKSQQLTTDPIHETIITDVINKATKIERSFSSDSYYRTYFPQDKAALESLIELLCKTDFPLDKIPGMIEKLKFDSKIKNRVNAAIQNLQNRS